MEHDMEIPISVFEHVKTHVYSLRNFWINNENPRARHIAQIIDDDLLLFRIIKVKTAHQNAIDRLRAGGHGFRCRSRSWLRRHRRSFSGAFSTCAQKFSTRRRPELGDPDVSLRKARV